MTTASPPPLTRRVVMFSRPGGGGGVGNHWFGAAHGVYGENVVDVHSFAGSVSIMYLFGGRGSPTAEGREVTGRHGGGGWGVGVGVYRRALASRAPRQRRRGLGVYVRSAARTCAESRKPYPRPRAPGATVHRQTVVYSINYKLPDRNKRDLTIRLNRTHTRARLYTVYDHYPLLQPILQIICCRYKFTTTAHTHTHMYARILYSVTVLKSLSTAITGLVYKELLLPWPPCLP